MGGRPWLEALKKHSSKRGEQQEETRDAIFADASVHDLTKPTKAPASVVNINTARTNSWGEDEHRLLAAGWSPKERCGPLGLTIWANPETGFYSSQESALHRLNERNEQ